MCRLSAAIGWPSERARPNCGCRYFEDRRLDLAASRLEARCALLNKLN